MDIAAGVRGELENRNYSTGLGGTLAIYRRGTMNAICKCPKPLLRSGILHDFGPVGLRFEKHVWVGDGILVPEWMIGQSRLRGRDYYSVAVVEVDDRSTVPAFIAGVPRIDDTDRHREQSRKAATAQTHQDRHHPPGGELVEERALQQNHGSRVHQACDGSVKQTLGSLRVDVRQGALVWHGHPPIGCRGIAISWVDH
jgi:hypothetical protein